MPNKPIETEAAPRAIGPYSQAIAVDGWLFCSGQIPVDPVTGDLVGEGDVRAQTERVLANLDAVLVAAGATRRDVTKATVYLADMEEFSNMNEVYADYFGPSTPPARACIQAAALPKGVAVEIDFIAKLSQTA